MKELTKSRLELFSANVQSIKGNFIWQNTLLKRMAALLYAAEDKVIDCDAIRESHELIKESTGLFSSFHGASAMSISALLSLTDDKNKRMTDALVVYDMLKSAKFRASAYLVVAAYQIAANTESDKYLLSVERAKAFYDGMKTEHYILTGQNDYIFAAMLGLSDIDIKIGLERMEQLYKTLKPKFLSGNAVQSLTQVLVLGGETAGMETRVLDLNDAFRQQGMKLDREYTLSSLGVLSLLPTDIDTIVNDVIGAYEFLRTQKGFSRWTLTKQELLLLSVALIAFEYVDDVKSGILTTTISTSLTNIIIAQQTAIAAAAASSAAASSSSSS